MIASAEEMLQRHQAAPGGAVVTGAEGFAGLDPDFGAAVQLAHQRMRAGDDEASSAHRRQAFERHRHPIGGLHLLLFEMKLRRGGANNGFDARRILLGRYVHFDTELARLLLEPAHRIGGRGIVAIQLIRRRADLSKRAESGEEEHGLCYTGGPLKDKVESMAQDIVIEIDDETLRLLTLKAELAGVSLDAYLKMLIENAAPNRTPPEHTT